MEAQGNRTAPFSGSPGQTEGPQTYSEHRYVTGYQCKEGQDGDSTYGDVGWESASGPFEFD